MRRAVLIFVAAVLFLNSPLSAGTDTFVVIVNEDNPVKTMSYTEVSDAFLTRSSQWPDHQGMLPVNLPADSPVRVEFSRVVLGKTVAAVETFVNRRLFSGQAKPPLVVKTEAEVLDFVRKNRGAIGYVSPSSTLSGVHAISLMIPPKRISFVAPRVPPTARHSSVQGTVILDVLVDVDGNVTQVDEVKGLGHGLTRAAVAAVKKWKFEPARIAGQPTEARVRVSVRFN